MCGGTVTDATAGTLVCLGKKRTWRRNRKGATLSFCVTAGHPGCLRLTLVFHIVHHPCRASYSTCRVQGDTTMALDVSNCNAQVPCAWLDGSAAPTMAPYDIDPCGCSDEDNDAIGTRQLDQLESRKSASGWKATLCLRLRPDTHRPGAIRIN
jgi:hypothetical protein